MLELNINEAKTLEFEVQIQGIGYKDLEGALRFVIDGVEYGFPATITETTVLVDIPPLSKIVRGGLKDGERASCKLEMWGDGFHMKPWTEQEIIFRVPVQVEAKIRGSTTDKKTKPKVEVKAIGSSIQEKNKIIEKREGREALLFRKVEEKLNSMRKTTQTKHKPTMEVKKNATINDVIKLMESRGMKNSKVQRMILEKLGYDEAEENCSGLYNQVKNFLDGRNLDLPNKLPKLRSEG